MAISGSAAADELADANKLLEGKLPAQAIALLAKLSDAGNPDAQLRLGQVYWYGEGVPVDRARGDALFAKAAAGGSKEAADALGLTAAREKNTAEIAYWTTGYDGADLTSGNYDCRAPVVPVRSTTNAEIKTTSDALTIWKACYNEFIHNLSDAMPAGKRIPEEVADLMTDPEMEQAKEHLSDVYKRVARGARASADKTMAAYDSWRKATEGYARDQDFILEHDRREQELISESNSRYVRPEPATLAPHK
jgi:TPR repeat protein